MKYFSNLVIRVLSLCLLCFVISTSKSYAQEPKIFTTADYDLKGNVKSCLVITDYGKEAFEFNENGLLTKLTTRYSDTDYDINYFKYEDGQLREKRRENYREDSLDRSTSIANIYSIDTLSGKTITEKIYSYQNEFLDQYKYFYDDEDRLFRIRRSNNEGLDETEVEYESIKEELTQTFILNGSIHRSVRTSVSEQKEVGLLKTVLEKEYLDGEPLKASERVLDTTGKILKEQKFGFDKNKGSFVLEQEIFYSYNEQDLVARKTIKSKDAETSQDYVYQLDGKNYGNWIKQIIMPQNTYTTRKIEYYEDIPIQE